MLRAAYANKLVGERFDFGRYPQGPNGEVKPITWRVLRSGSDALLVISEYGLDAGPYNEKRVSITWSACTLRRWLNGEFFRKAFSPQEQSLIKVSRLSNKAGRLTEDRVFLLSADESERLFAGNNDRAAEPTVYAVKNGAYARGGYAWQWLRSRGRSGGCAAYVGADSGVHSFDGRDVVLVSGCVRPALQIVF
ncbi:hypothetical protein IJT93_06320 [bacterium]|nr:hypothetical protein [bacterium]